MPLLVYVVVVLTVLIGIPILGFYVKPTALRPIVYTCAKIFVQFAGLVFYRTVAIRNKVGYLIHPLNLMANSLANNCLPALGIAGCEDIEDFLLFVFVDTLEFINRCWMLMETSNVPNVPTSPPRWFARKLGFIDSKTKT